MFISFQVSFSTNQTSHAGPKVPGLMVLEHENSDQSVQAFIDNFPAIRANGWTFASLAEVCAGNGSYQNAMSSSSDDVDHMDVTDGNELPDPTPSGSANSSASG